MLNEDALEQLSLQWFQETGWDYVCGYDIAPGEPAEERTDYRQVVLEGRLLDALKRLNPGVPESTLDEVVRQVRTRSHPGLLQSNQAFHELLLRGVPIEVEENGVKRGSRAQLVDFTNTNKNRFLVVNQYTIQGTKGNRRPDIVCFINGLPIAVIELKNPTKEETGIWEAFNQFTTYKDEISDLFVFNEALVISDGINARVGSLTADRERFQPWRVIKNEDDRPLLEFELEKVVRGFFAPELLLDYLRYFVLFEQGVDTEGGMVKKIAGYHQFHAIREVVRATVLASTKPLADTVQERRAPWGELVTPGSRMGGIVWHTQGSGKSISMACFVGKLIAQPEMKNPTIVVVTDRNDLDGQLYQTFKGARGLLPEDPVQIEDRDDLRQKLLDRQTGGIIFTTIQKFRPEQDEERFPRLSARENIVVIADEAHRSQYGLEAKLNKKTGKYTYGFATHLRDALPHATFVGFTGTPIESADKDTRAIFGDYISIYDIQDAVDDGATVPIYYESRLAKLDINKAEIEQLNEEVEEVLEDEESLAERESTKSKWSQLAKLVGAEPRLAQVAADLVQHFEQRNASMEGKGMIVCMSRDICVGLYDALVALRPDWHDPDPTKGAIKIVMTGSAQDKDLLKPHIYSSTTKKLLEKRFKDPKDPLKLVIVRDMWLTGFDAPCLHTMYVDKPMKGHNLMQAIARVNRVFGTKTGGLVVDYLGIAAELKQALKTYTENRGKGAPAVDNREAYALLAEQMDIARNLLHGFDYATFPTHGLMLLVPAANFLLDPEKVENGKKRWFDVVVKITKAFSLCGTLDEALALREEIAFFQAIRIVILKASTPEKQLSNEAKNALLKQILDNAVIAEGVEDIFQLANIERPNLGILSDAFLQDIHDSPNRNFALELLQRLLNDEVKSRMRNNVVQEQKYSDRLQASLNRYHSRAIDSAQIIAELIEMAKEFRKDADRGQDLGLSPSELAFYDALANDPSAIREMADDTLKALARELTEKLRKSTTVDWQKRESVRARLRNLVRITLRRHKYPPEYTDDAVQLVLSQAERLADDWSQSPNVA